MFFILFVILSVTLFVPLMGAVWLLGDSQLTRRIKKELAGYECHVVSVNETRRKFSLPGKIKPLIILNYIYGWGPSETTQFREVTFTKGNQTYTCLAALKTARFQKAVLYFDIEPDTLLPKVYDNTDPQSLYRKTIT